MRKPEIDIGWQVIDCRADPLQVSGHEVVIDILSKLVSRPFFLSLFACEIKRRNGIAVEGCFLLILNDCVMTVDPNQPMVMRKGKGKDLAVELLFAPHGFVEFDDTSHGKRHTMRILSICNVKSHDAALNLAG